jgi:hypothetical protein
MIPPPLVFSGICNEEVYGFVMRAPGLMPINILLWFTTILTNTLKNIWAFVDIVVNYGEKNYCYNWVQGPIS